MFEFLKKISRKKDEDDEEKEEAVNTTNAILNTENVARSSQEAAVRYAKSDTYSRTAYEDKKKMDNFKKSAFEKGNVTDPNLNTKLEMKISAAKQKYGNKWQEHIAETDHTVPLQNIHEKNKNNPFLREEDIKTIANSEDNLEVTSRKFNNAKRSRTNEEFLKDEEYLERTGIEMSNSEKEAAIKRGNTAQTKINRKINRTALKNTATTFHESGLTAAKESARFTIVMSTIVNTHDVISGKKSAKEAVADTGKDIVKSGTSSYFMSGGLTTMTQALSSSKSQFIKGLAQANVPAKVITAVMVTGDTLKKYANGEITTQECILEIGEKGVSMAVANYTGMIGQTLIPIPVVGYAVGALVGSVMTSKYCNQLINDLQTKQLEHDERMRIIAEYNAAAEQERIFRAELESYLNEYMNDYKHCFDQALDDIHLSFASGDADGVIRGANKITRKLGGKVHYDSVEEFNAFLLSDTTDVL